MNTPDQHATPDAESPHGLPDDSPFSSGRLAIFWPLLTYLTFFPASFVAVQDFFGGEEGVACFVAHEFPFLPSSSAGVALVQLMLGILRLRAKDASGRLHILSSLIVVGL